MIIMLFCTFFVYCTDRYVTEGGSGNGDCSSIANACSTLAGGNQTVNIVVEKVILNSDISYGCTIKSNIEGSYANVTFSGSYTINGGSLIFTDIRFLFPSTDTSDIPTTSRFVSSYGGSIITHCIFEQVDKEIYSLKAPLISFAEASHSVTNSEFTNILRTDDSGKGGIFYLDG
jgi:hypothetical protein